MDGPWVVYFQNRVRWPQPPSKMAAMSRHRFNIHCRTLWDLNVVIFLDIHVCSYWTVKYSIFGIEFDAQFELYSGLHRFNCYKTHIYWYWYLLIHTSGDHNLHPRWLPWADIGLTYIVEPYGIWIVKLRCIRHADILKRAYLCQYLELNLMLSLNCILVYIDLTVIKHIYIGTGTY
jgi:hypothetical protein